MICNHFWEVVIHHALSLRMFNHHCVPQKWIKCWAYLYFAGKWISIFELKYEIIIVSNCEGKPIGNDSNLTKILDFENLTKGFYTQFEYLRIVLSYRYGVCLKRIKACYWFSWPCWQIIHHSTKGNFFVWYHNDWSPEKPGPIGFLCRIYLLYIVISSG